MESDFYTLHNFMVFTKGVVYYLIIATLIGFVGFWKFLTARDED